VPQRQQARFIFWVRSRDDARGPDVTPAFQSFNVVAPKYERDLLIADGEMDFQINPEKLTRAKLYWDSIYRLWRPGSTPSDFIWIPTTPRSVRRKETSFPEDVAKP